LLDERRGPQRSEDTRRRRRSRRLTEYGKYSPHRAVIPTEVAASVSLVSHQASTLAGDRPDQRGAGGCALASPARITGQAEIAIAISAIAGSVDDAMVPLMLPPRGRQ